MTPEEIKKKAYERYPVKMGVWYDLYGNAEEEDTNEAARNAYIQAYKEISALPTIKGWVARDGCGMLYLYYAKPHRDESGNNWWMPEYGKTCTEIEESFFPDLRWEDEPIEVELPIIRK